MNIQDTANSERNPLALLAVAGLLAIGKCLWHVIGTGGLTAFDLVDFAFWSAFLILYVKRHRLAWLVSFIVFAIIAPLDLFVFQPRRANHPTSVEVNVITAAIWLGFVTYVLYVRPRYWRYLARETASQETK